MCLADGYFTWVLTGKDIRTASMTNKKGLADSARPLICMVPSRGIEPRTRGFSVLARHTSLSTQYTTYCYISVCCSVFLAQLIVVVTHFCSHYVGCFIKAVRQDGESALSTQICYLMMLIFWSALVVCNHGDRYTMFRSFPITCELRRYN